MSTVTDIEAILGRDLTTEEAYRVPRLIEMAEAAVSRALPGFSLVEGDETVTIVGHGNEIWTPKYPVTAINSLTVGAAVFTDGSYTFDDKGKITFGEQTILNAFEIEPWAWYSEPGPFTIDYDFGLAELPADIAGAIAGAVAVQIRQYAINPGNVKSESLGAYSVTYSDSEAIGITDSLRHQLRGWRRNAQVSVAMRP